MRAIDQADLLVLGPGSLYTSIIPNLLIPGIRAAIERSRAPKVLVMNLMTQPGETDGMTAVEHLEAIEQLAGPDLVDVALISEERPPDPLLARYAESGSARIEVDRDALRGHEVELVECDLLVHGKDDRGDGLVRHDPEKLARAVVGLAGR